MLSADGRFLVTGSYDGTARVWDTHTGAQLSRLEGHKGTIMDLALTPDGNTLVTGGLDGKTLVWDLRDKSHPKPAFTPSEHTTRIESVSLSDDGMVVASGGLDTTARSLGSTRPRNRASSGATKKAYRR